MEYKLMDAGVKKNTAGEQVCGNYSISKGAGLRESSWVAGLIKTSWRFL
jgi:hypothetical protein